MRLQYRHLASSLDLCLVQKAYKNLSPNLSPTPLTRKALKVYFNFLALGHSKEWLLWAAEWSRFPEALIVEDPASLQALINLSEFFNRHRACPVAQAMYRALEFPNLHVPQHLRDAESLKILRRYFLRHSNPWQAHEIHQAMHTRFCEPHDKPLIPGGTPLQYSVQRAGSFAGAVARIQHGKSFVPQWLRETNDFAAHVSEKRKAEMAGLDLTLGYANTLAMSYIQDIRRYNGGPEAMLGFEFKGGWGVLCLATYYRNAQRVGEIVFVSLNPAWRGQGLGRKLIDFGSRVLAQDANAERIILKLVNAGMVPHYEKRGFQYEGLERVSGTQFLAVLGQDIKL